MVACQNDVCIFGQLMKIHDEFEKYEAEKELEAKVEKCDKNIEET